MRVLAEHIADQPLHTQRFLERVERKMRSLPERRTSAPANDLVSA